MTAAKGKVALSDFLDGLDTQTVEANEEDLRRLRDRLTHLKTHLNTEPQIAAQTDKLLASIPPSLAGSPQNERKSAVRAARSLAADLKERWIAADAPPLVDEIDGHLSAIDTDLGALERSDAAALRKIAAQIDNLAEPGRRMKGIERRFRPWAILGSILFLLGVMLVFRPEFLAAAPAIASVWTVLFCLGFLPGLAVLYAWRVMPRSRADAQIDQLNRGHFLPYGGLYFPADEQPAGVILVDYTPPAPEEADRPKDPRKNRDHERSI